MKAFYCLTSTTDLVRTIANPIINEIDRELFTDYADFVFDCSIRFMGIKKLYPNAEFVKASDGVKILVNGVIVYWKRILQVEPTPVEIDED